MERNPEESESEAQGWGSTVGNEGSLRPPSPCKHLASFLPHHKTYLFIWPVRESSILRWPQLPLLGQAEARCLVWISHLGTGTARPGWGAELEAEELVH